MINFNNSWQIPVQTLLNTLTSIAAFYPRFFGDIFLVELGSVRYPFGDMIVHENARTYVFVLVFTSFAHPMSCKHNELVTFTQKTVTDLTLAADPAFVVNFAHAEERQKLCYYAKMLADLAYMDYSDDSIPTWHTVESSEFSYGMPCATLPTVYIVRRPLNPVLEITYIQHAVDQFKFSAQIVVVKSVKKEEAGTSVDSEWNQLSAESREHLCSAARERVSPLHFLHHEVAATQTYTFEDFAGKTKIRDAFFCPTVPRLYLRPGNSEKEVEIVHLPSTLDDYEFELEKINPTLIHQSADKANIHTESSLTQLSPEDRKSLCNVARRYYTHSLAQDSDVRDAHLYPFQYQSEEPEVHNVTIICPALPQMYLRADSKMSGDKKTKIFITFVQTSADRYSYVLEVVISAYRIVVPTEKDETIWENHQFATLNEEDTWNFCSAAQKYIMGERGRSLNFTFAEKSDIFHQPKVLLISGHVLKPQLYEIEQLDKEWEMDALIKCSEWPRMFLRQGQSEKAINIILMKHELKTMPTD